MCVCVCVCVCVLVLKCLNSFVQVCPLLRQTGGDLEVLVRSIVSSLLEGFILASGISKPKLSRYDFRQIHSPSFLLWEEGLFSTGQGDRMNMSRNLYQLHQPSV